MRQDVQPPFSHILWVGGAPDSGKSTAAQILAKRHKLEIYHYDHRDLAHHEQLAERDPTYQAFLASSLDERWVLPDPNELFKRMLQSSRDRFPLVIEDLVALPREQWIVVEGFGLLPDLLSPYLCCPFQAIWLVPTKAFKMASMIRRGKPSFGAQVSDPIRAKTNLLMRDWLLTEFIRAQVLKFGYKLYEVDGTRSAYEMADLIEQHFASNLFQ